MGWLREQADKGEQADLIFVDLDKTCYEPIYRMVRGLNLLKPSGLLLCDNVLYRGLTPQLDAGEMPEVSAKTRANAEALVRFNNLVKKDVRAGHMRSLMMPVRDGMMAVMRDGPMSVEDTAYEHSSENSGDSGSEEGSRRAQCLPSCAEELVVM